MNHEILPESYWITQRCATQEHVIKTAECPWCSIAALEARCRQMDAVVRTVASLYLGPKGFCSGSLLKLREAAINALAAETGTKACPECGTTNPNHHVPYCPEANRGEKP